MKKSCHVLLVATVAACAAAGSDLPDFASDPAAVTAYRAAAVAIADRKLKETDEALAASDPVPGLGRRLSSGGHFGGFFLWDSVFQALWGSRVRERDYPVLSMLDNFYRLQLPNGFIVREYSTRGLPVWKETHPVSLNPPILSWAEIELYRNHTSDKARLSRVYPNLVRFHEAVRRIYRRPDGLYFGDQLGCGMDDIVRSPYGISEGAKRKGGIPFTEKEFGVGAMIPELDGFRDYWIKNRAADSSWNRQAGWIDITSQMAFDCLNLAAVADVLGKGDEAARWRAEHAEIAAAVNAKCWDEQRGFYFDCWDGGTIPRYHAGAFWTMLARIPTPERASRMVKAFFDPQLFGTPVPFTCLAASDPDYRPEEGYWCGAVWPPTAYVAIRGLKEIGFGKEAETLARRYYNATCAIWRKTGTVWENISSVRWDGPKKNADDEFCGWAALAPILLPEEFGWAGGAPVAEDGLVFTDGIVPAPADPAFARYELSCLRETGETLVVTGSVDSAGVRPLAEGLHALKPLAGKGETVRFLAFDPPGAFDAQALARALPQAAEKIGKGGETVLFFAGDSVTATGDYGRMLALMLRRATGNRRIRAAKHAYAGCSADASVRNFARDTSADRPDAVFVMYGLNDAACSIPCEVFTGELAWLAREAKARFSADTVYLTPTPHFADDVNPRRTVGFGELVRRTGEEDGVTVVDAFDAIWSARANWKRLYPPAFFRPFEATGAEPGDTIHPNALGHLRIARRAYETLMGRAKGPSPVVDAAELPVDPPCRAQMKARTAAPTWCADGKDVLRLGLPEHATSSSGRVEDNRASPDEGTSDWCVSAKGRDLVFTMTTDAANRKDTFNLFFDSRAAAELGTMGPYYWIECRLRDDGSVELRPGESSPAGAQATGSWRTADGRIRAEITVPARVFGAEDPVLPLGFSLVWRHTGPNGKGTRLSWSERCHEWNPTGYGRIVAVRSPKGPAADPLAYVDPFIGTAGNGHTTPAAAYPFGMVQAGPDTGRDGWAYCSGYQHGDTRILRFSQTHLSGTGCSDDGDLGLLPFVGGTVPLTNGVACVKATEKASPGFYAVSLEGGVDVEVVATERTALYRIRSANGPARLLLDPTWAFGRVVGSKVRPREGRRIVGHLAREGWVRREYFFAVELSHEPVAEERIETPGYGLPPKSVYDFALKPGEPLLVKVSLSISSLAGATRNLAAELPDWDFDAVRARTEAKWRALLGRVEAEGPRERLVALYTSLYHLCFQPNVITDVGEKPLYSTFSTWDTFRAAHPLYTILCPEYVMPFVDSMMWHADRNGHLPIWTLWKEDNQCMIGTHGVPVAIDAYLKGFPVDAERLFAQVKRSLAEPHVRWKEDWDLLDRYGYYPFDIIRGESVSRTLECAYDDWCAGRLAERLGKADDAAFFFRRAANWKNVFDPTTGFARGRDTKGAWRTPFDPFALGHGSESDNDFTEGNAFQYTWHVMQDPEGLIAAMGGAEAFERRLDALFKAPERIDGKDCVVDISGLIGQYVHGNEPSHHVLYFYPLIGRPEKAAARIGEIFERFYGTTPDGLCGNDDCGQMSAWYVFSALGFYPFNPCGGEYIIGAPQVEKVTLHCSPSSSSSPTFTVIAKNLSKENKYVKSVTLNGKPITDWRIRHEDIVKGGELRFVMMP